MDVSKQKYNHLTAIKFVRKNKGGKSVWLFECDCENKTRKELVLSEVKTGHTKSCGCLKKIHALENNKKYCTTHNKKHTKLYHVWQSMKQRCYNKNHKFYKDYGGRGIKICDEWKSDINKFWDWAIKNGYKEGLSIDRINNDGDYEPNNCRWSTHREQQLNKRNNRLLEFNNRIQTLSEWSEELSIQEQTIRLRLKRGLSTEEALSK